MMRGALLSFQLARSKPYFLELLPVRSLCCAQEITPTLLIAKSLPPFYPRAVHVISRTRLSPVVFYYGFKGRSLYASRGEPGDEASHGYHPLFCCMDASLFTTPFGTSIPTSFNILNENVFILVSLVFATDLCSHKPLQALLDTYTRTILNIY